MAKWRDSTDEDYILPSKDEDEDEDFKTSSTKTDFYKNLSNYIDFDMIKILFIKVLIWIFIIENLYLLSTFTQQKEFIQQLGYRIVISVKNFLI